MLVCKLSTGKVVQLLRPAARVQFADGTYILVSDRLSDNPRKLDPYWVPSSLVVWVLAFN